MRIWARKGWFGIRVGRRYFVVKDNRRYRAYFSERNRIRCRYFTVGNWRFLVRWNSA